MFFLATAAAVHQVQEEGAESIKIDSASVTIASHDHIPRYLTLAEPIVDPS